MAAIQSVKGTRDFYPEGMAFRQWLYARIREVSESFGYQEFDGPFLERLELYAAKSGEELVKEQSFVFPDRSGEMIALRPELTPSLARMVATRSKSLVKPIRWWSFGPFWRYERPQMGRAREFFQWNIDLLGVDSPQADAEIAAIAAILFDKLGLDQTEVKLLVNNRRLAEDQLASLGISPERYPSIFQLIDRRDRTSPTSWEAETRRSGLDDDQRLGLGEMLQDQEAWRKSDELVDFFNAVNAMGVGEYIEYDPSVIRGLDYYTGTVFEGRDRDRRYRAILGGGRYDNLVADVGGEPIPGVGFAMGDMVIPLVIEALGKAPDLKVNPADVLVLTFGEDIQTEALQLASELRQAEVRVEWYLIPDRLAKQLKYADRQGIPLVAILGPDERSAGVVTVKDMRTGQQEQIARAELVGRIRALIA